MNSALPCYQVTQAMPHDAKRSGSFENNPQRPESGSRGETGLPASLVAIMKHRSPSSASSLSQTSILQQHQQVVAELEETRSQLDQALQEKQHLVAQYQTLSSIAKELQEVLARLTQHLQSGLQDDQSLLPKVIQRERVAPPESLPVSPPLPDPSLGAHSSGTTAGDSSTEGAASYEYLQRLKQRRTSGRSTTSKFKSAPPTGEFVFPEKRDPRQPRSSYGRGKEFSQFDSGEGNLQDLFEHLETEPGDRFLSPDPYSRSRERRPLPKSSQSSSLGLWIAGTLLLIMGSAGAGFMIVQLIMQRNENPPAQAPSVNPVP
jgi:uncharacterized membrane-anchored protein YhcB (DUF1043 family)